MNDYITPPSCQVKELNKLYLDYFGYKDNGFFVDVGAYDGIEFSNTYGLAVAGWGGICYEPVPSLYERCMEAHKDHKVKVINTCIGNKKGFINFTVEGTLSTYSEYHMRTDQWKNRYAKSQRIVSRIITLDESLKENNVPAGFDVLSLDVEGSETDVLSCFHINYWKPKMAIIEAQELHPAEELRFQAGFINDYFIKAGYKKIYCDEINNIYVL